METNRRVGRFLIQMETEHATTYGETAVGDKNYWNQRYVDKQHTGITYKNQNEIKSAIKSKELFLKWHIRVNILSDWSKNVSSNWIKESLFKVVYSLTLNDGEAQKTRQIQSFVIKFFL